jgi:hypothetical protein
VLPVPAELLVYTLKEWKALLQAATRFARTLELETVWVLDHPFEAPHCKREDL